MSDTEALRPRAFAGDEVFARPHRGAPRWGSVSSVDTHYTRERQPYHVYAVLFPGGLRRQWLGDEQIIRVVVAL